MLRGLCIAETKVALIQRSCGYASRPTLDIAEIDMAVQIIKSQQPGCLVVVDNCYGEFTDTKEPCAVSSPSKSFHQSVNELINQSINQSMNQSVSQSINQSINQPVN